MFEISPRAGAGTTGLAPLAILPSDGFRDWQGLLALLHRAFAFMEGRVAPPSSLHRLDAGGLAAKARAERCFLASRDGRPVGCVFCEPRRACLYVGKLAIDPPAQGQGIGRALMGRAEAEARALGLPALELQTRIELVENHAAFAALGFVRTGQTAHPGFDRPTSITMRKELDVSDDPDLARHAAKMAKKKAARDKIMATKTEQRGLIIVHTGKGKGKSTAAFGMIFRHIAHGMPCAVVQFIKGGMATGERALIAERFAELCEFHTMGEGFTWETQDKARDVAAARGAWEKAKELIRSGLSMVLLDEINIALRYDYIDIAEVVAFLKAEKPPMTHVVLTGRNAKDELVEIADLVTEMELIKHPFRSGVKAQQGVEF